MQQYPYVLIALVISVTADVLGSQASAKTPQAPRVARHTSCEVEGVWEQVSVAFDGQEMPPHSRPLRKIVYRGHWIEIGTEAHRDKLPQQTEADKLRATQTFGGAGTYTTTDRTFTQHIDQFSNPSVEGATLTGTCRTEGNLWYYSFSTVGVPGMNDWGNRVDEVFRRIR